MNMKKLDYVTSPVRAIDSREDWLMSAINLLRPLCAARGFPIPEKVRASCGFPGGRRARKAVGQCWSQLNSGDGFFEIFISPQIDDPIDVLETLVHELGHASVGLDAGHRRPFAKFCEAMGLLPPWKSTTPGPAFKQGVAAPVLKALEVPYPHAKLRPSDQHSGPKKQTTRLMKCDCPKCGYTLRTTMKWLLVSGAPLCPSEGCNGERMDWA
jgi:hypothetical protein